VSLTYNSRLFHDLWVHKGVQHLNGVVKVGLKIWHLRMILKRQKKVFAQKNNIECD
jgi:hypothetical protein